MLPLEAAWLPHPAHLGPHHPLARLAAECLLELGQVGNNAIHAVFTGRMRIDGGTQPQIFRALIFTGPLSVADEEPLLGCESVDGLQGLPFGLIFPGDVGEQEPAKVSHVFAAS